MFQRYKWSLLRYKHEKRTLKELHLLLIDSLSSSQVCLTRKAHNFSQENFSQYFKERKLVLKPDIVQSFLLECSSDLMALSFFLWCAKQNNYFHNPQAFDYMVSIVKNLNVRYTTVEEVVRGLDSVGCGIKAQTFLLLLRIYWRGKMYRMVFEAFEAMSSFGFVPNTFARNIVMDVLYKTGHVDLAIKVLKETPSPNFLSFNIALCNLCKLNDLTTVKDVIKLMLRAGFYPNVDTFELMLNCFCKMGRLPEAYQILGLMTTLEISVSVNIWTILIDGFCGLHQPEKACCLLMKMLEVGCSPNVVTYTTLTKGFLDSGMVSRAFSILDDMKSRGCVPDLVLCNALIDCFSKIGKYNDALDVYLSLSDCNLVPDSYTFSSLLSNLRLSRRISLLPKLRNGHLIDADLVVCNSLLSYYCKAKSPSDALELYNNMLDRGFVPDNYSFAALLCGLCKAGKIDEAINIYQGMIIKYSGLDAHIHTIIIDGLIRAGQHYKAIRLFRRAVLEKFSLDVVSYTVAIRGLVGIGSIREAYSLYIHMKEIGIFPNAHTYNVLISGFCKERDIIVVEQLLIEISKDNIQLNFGTLIKVTKFIGKYKPDSTTINQLYAMWNLRYQSDEAKLTPSLDSYQDGNMDMGSSSSEDLPEFKAAFS